MRNKIAFLTAAASALVFLSGTQARAWNQIQEGVGENLHWNGANNNWYIAQGPFPSSQCWFTTTAEQNGRDHAVTEWKRVRAVMGTVATKSTTPYCVEVNGNGQNEFRQAISDDLPPGKNGWSDWVFSGGCWNPFFGDCLFEDCDSKVLNTLSFNLNEESPSTDGLTVLLHELGHCHGLDHEDVTYLSIMKQASPRGVVGNITAARRGILFPDDAQGARAIHSGGGWVGTETGANVFSSAQIQVSGNIQNWVSAPGNVINVCRGSTSEPSVYTFGNRGVSTASNVRARTFLTQKLKDGASGFYATGPEYAPVTDVNYNIGAHVVTSASTAMVVFTSFPLGLYRSFHWIDATGAVSEPNEWDNLTTQLVQYQIVSCP